jgi:predicted transcriptional regulator of viral defense system
MSYTGSLQAREDLLALAHQMGVLRARDLVAHGIARDYLAPLVVEGRLKRVDRGLYVLPEAVQSTHYPLAEATKRVPGGIICLHSALAFHHLTPHTSDEIWVAMNRGTHHPKTTTLPLHVLRFSGLARSFGVEEHRIDGVQVRVYSPAKTVADCFKFRYKLGVEVALEALRETWYARRATLSDLWEAAQVCRVTSVMRPYLEMLGGS